MNKSALAAFVKSSFLPVPKLAYLDLVKILVSGYCALSSDGRSQCLIIFFRILAALEAGEGGSLVFNFLTSHCQ